MTHQRGEDRPQAKLKESDVVAIRARIAAGDRLTVIALDYPQVSRVAVHHIIHGRRWKHVAMPVHGADATAPVSRASSGKTGAVSGLVTVAER